LETARQIFGEWDSSNWESWTRRTISLVGGERQAELDRPYLQNQTDRTRGHREGPIQREKVRFSGCLRLCLSPCQPVDRTQFQDQLAIIRVGRDGPSLAQTNAPVASIVHEPDGLRQLPGEVGHIRPCD